MKVIKDLLGSRYKLKIDGKHLEEFQECMEDERIIDPIYIKFYDKERENFYGVNIQESHGCCGKLYMYDIDSNHDLHKIMLKTVEELAKWLGYSYLGFIHHSDHDIVHEGKSEGFMELLQFQNARSGNTLSEMCKIVYKSEK